MVFDIGIIVTIVYFLRSLERDGVAEKFFKLSGAQEQELILFVHERSHCYVVRCNRPSNGVSYVGFDPNRMITSGKNREGRKRCEVCSVSYPATHRVLQGVWDLNAHHTKKSYHGLYWAFHGWILYRRPLLALSCQAMIQNPRAIILSRKMVSYFD